MLLYFCFTFAFVGLLYSKLRSALLFISIFWAWGKSLRLRTKFRSLLPFVNHCWSIGRGFIYIYIEIYTYTYIYWKKRKTWKDARLIVINYYQLINGTNNKFNVEWCDNWTENVLSRCPRCKGKSVVEISCHCAENNDLGFFGPL